MEDLFYTLLGIAVFVLPIVFIVRLIKGKRKKKNKKNLGNDNITNNIVKENVKKKEKQLRIEDVKHIEGISALTEDEYCTLNVESEQLTIISKIGNFNIPLNRIINAGIVTKNEMETKNKNIVGRTLVGSMFGVGLLGAMSGIGQKVINKHNNFLVINYKDKNTEEIKALVFGLGTSNTYNSLGQAFVYKLTSMLITEKVDIEL